MFQVFYRSFSSRFFSSGLIINPISELDFFPEPYVFYIVSVFATALLFMVGLSYMWTIFDKHWRTIIIDGDNVVLKRYLPLKINSFSYKQLKSTDIERWWSWRESGWNILTVTINEVIIWAVTGAIRSN